MQYKLIVVLMWLYNITTYVYNDTYALCLMLSDELYIFLNFLFI